MKISQILIQPINQRFNAGTLTIKTCKKTWQVKKVWYHQVKLTDGTDEIPADVKIGKYLPLKSGQEITVIIGFVRDSEYLGKPCRILFVDQYSIPTITMAEYDSQEDDWSRMREDEIKSKVRCWLVAASLQGRSLSREEILGWQDFVIDGKL